MVGDYVGSGSVGWTASLLALGAAYGTIADDIRSFVADNRTTLPGAPPPTRATTHACLDDRIC